MVQAQDKPDARSAMENDANEVALVFLSSAWTQVLDEPYAWILVMAGAQARDEPDLRRSVPENEAAEVASLLLQAPVFLFSAVGHRCGTSPTHGPS